MQAATHDRVSPREAGSAVANNTRKIGIGKAVINLYVADSLLIYSRCSTFSFKASEENYIVILYSSKAD
jgi:hypothetical protein